MPEQEQTDPCLAGGGEAGALLRSIDWSKTPLGAVKTWPQSLRTMIGVMLASRFGMRLIWGPEFIFLYNDAYRPILGEKKHPSAMGSRTSESFHEVWHIVGPLFARVFNGEAVGLEDTLLPLQRNGYLEECYFTLSYSPIRDDRNVVGGVLGVVAETTARVLAERRLRTLRQLASRTAPAKTPEAACAFAVEALIENRADVPFALFYLTEPDGRQARLGGVAGLPDGCLAAPPRVSLTTAAGVGWPLGEATAGRALVVSDVVARFGPIQAGPYAEVVHTAVVLVLTRSGLAQPYGFFVAGVNPRKALDDEYEGFFELAAEHVVAAVSNAVAFEEQRRRAEALAELDAAKTTFFTSVSHEFRTPLTLMLGPLENALSTPDGALAREDLVAAHRNAVRLLKLVNSLLEFSRIEAGRVQARYEATDIGRLTRELASAFASIVQSAGLLFDVQCASLDEPVYIDRAMWETMVLNLVSNAFKFTFSGGIYISLVQAEGACELRVRDTGIGIPASELPRLFERFHRVEGARSRTHEGSGIGLALVQEFAKLHGGTLQVQSEVGHGTLFTVRIPLGTAHLPAERIGLAVQPRQTPLAAAAQVSEALRWLQAETAAEPALPRARRAAAARILLVEDNADMRNYVERLLSERWEVETAADGIAGLTAVRERRPDLVITDVMMPRLDGFGLLRALRGNPATRTIPVVLLSAAAGEESSAEGLAQGANDYLVKPFSARDLLGRVAAQLENSRVQRAVQERSEIERTRLHSFLMEAPAAIAILRGPSLTFELANARYDQIIGHRDVIGKPGRQALPELVAQGVWDIFDHTYATGKPFVANGFPAQLDRRGDGTLEEGFFNWIVQATHDVHGHIDGVMLFAIEVTEQVHARRQIESSRAVEEELRVAAEAANRAKDEFLAMLGHELRNPLAPIVTALHLMRLRGGDVATKERVIIERQVEHLTRLVDDLLDVSRITRGKVELDKKRIEIADVVARAIEIASPLLEQRQHHLSIAVPPMGLAVQGDATRLAQVVSNLLTNAAKYTAPGGRITVTGTRAADAVILTVQDTGMGISPTILPTIFELFVQERQALDRSQGGLGLGLTIVRSLVHLHDGSVTAASDGIGCGSTFTIRLPFSPQTDSVQSPPQPTTQTPEATVPAGRRVLVVDDNEDAADLLATSLELLGYVTRTAYDGPTALRIADEFAPEVALLDIGLPVMDGYEVARRLKSATAACPLHLVALTGYGQESDRARSTNAGFDAHLVKPVELSVIEALLRKFMQ